jgi:cell filamentation protein
MPEPDDHYYVAGSSPEADPHVQANGVLINTLNITNTADLAKAEAEVVLYTTGQLWESPVQGQFDLPHLQEIHRRLFQEIYPWAGELRRADIGKGDTWFQTYLQIPQHAQELFTQLQAERHLKGLSQKAFCERAAEYLGRLNMIHPFREGNGRTQREFIGQLARESGLLIDWSGYAPAQMIQACIAARDGDYNHLRRILTVGIKAFPDL